MPEIISIALNGIVSRKKNDLIRITDTNADNVCYLGPQKVFLGLTNLVELIEDKYYSILKQHQDMMLQGIFNLLDESASFPLDSASLM